MLNELHGREQSDDLHWSGLIEAGYRFVHRTGSLDRFDTDVDLASGLRLRALETSARGSQKALASEFSFAAHDLGDPRWDVSARARKDEAWDFGASHRSDEFRYRADGDLHRVDRDSDESRYDASVNLSANLRAFASLVQHTEDGFWLTQRIDNRNQPVQTFVDGVASPRRVDSDESELGLGGGSSGWHWTAALQYLEERSRDRVTFSQLATANPAFPDSEDFRSRATLHGPGGRAALTGDFGCLALDLSSRYVDHNRSIDASGNAAGYDVAPFTTVTDAAGEGSARTWLIDASATLHLCDQLRVVTDLHWREHSEAMRLAQTDVSTYPTLNTVVTVATDADLRTEQRLFDGSAALEWSALTTLDLTIGYGFAREQLRVPGFPPGDPGDFRRGTTRDSGVLAGLRWHPDTAWTLRGDLRDFGEDGAPLHELAPERDREASGSLGWNGGGKNVTVFARDRRNENAISRHHLENFTTGLSVGVQRAGLSLYGAYTFSRIDSRTLTNFYFDPDPNPVPTFVGFHGDTHTVSGSLSASPSADVHWEVTAAFTRTNGSFDVGFFEWRSDLRWQVAPPGGDLGVEFRQLRYTEQDSLDGWSAAMVFVYWRQQW